MTSDNFTTSAERAAAQAKGEWVTWAMNGGFPPTSSWFSELPLQIPGDTIRLNFTSWVSRYALRRHEAAARRESTQWAEESPWLASLRRRDAEILQSYRRGQLP